jgi:DNA-binding transcriptional regulator LsrR (DeoR family)
LEHWYIHIAAVPRTVLGHRDEGHILDNFDYIAVAGIAVVGVGNALEEQVLEYLQVDNDEEEGMDDKKVVAVDID